MTTYTLTITGAVDERQGVEHAEAALKRAAETLCAVPDTTAETARVDFAGNVKPIVLCGPAEPFALSKQHATAKG